MHLHYCAEQNYLSMGFHRNKKCICILCSEIFFAVYCHETVFAVYCHIYCTVGTLEGYDRSLVVPHERPTPVSRNVSITAVSSKMSVFPTFKAMITSFHSLFPTGRACSWKLGLGQKSSARIPASLCLLRCSVWVSGSFLWWFLSLIGVPIYFLIHRFPP